MLAGGIYMLHDYDCVQQWLFRRRWFIATELMLLIVCGASVFNYLRLRDANHRIVMSWVDGDLLVCNLSAPSNLSGVANLSDVPYVVITHLSGVSGTTRVTACLPEAVVSTAFDGPIFRKAMIEKLVWRDKYGEPHSPPLVGSPITALYYFPQQSHTN
jgi:hypothetical protein